ncbi:MAG: type II/IV secretion system protein [Bacteroidales bacterium]|nr:type II/IV secretion system protein [Bacteroidales bacterium]
MDIKQNFTVETEALQVFTAEEALYYRLLPYHMDEAGGLSCLGEDGLNYDAVINEISGVFGKAVSIQTVPNEELTRLLAVHYRNGDAGVAMTSEHIEDIPGLIDEAYRMRASDIHMEPSEQRCRVRFRIDGKLLERHIIPKASYMALVNRIKIMSNLDISEKRLPQDGRIIHEGKEAKFDIRTSILPTIYGEKIVLRLLTMNNQHLSLAQLGFDERQYKDYVKAVSHPHGMILISGPTGSGKSTTLYATLELLNRGDNNILTIEDPVEYTLDGVNQVQLKEDIGLDFPMALRTFLRQDPDIIMLGEIRDEATAEMAVRSSLTGHLLLSTLHTNSAWGCITRLVDMGIHPYLLSETLIACVAQRLVRTLCPHCKQAMEENEFKHIPISLAPSAKPCKPVGCEHCFYTGYLGRKALYEVLPMDGELSMAIRENRSSVDEIIAAKGLKTLKETAVDLFSRGETSLDEVLPFMN